MKTAVVADDHVAICVGIRFLLQKMGFTAIHETSKLAQIATLVRSTQPDIIILDVEFPEGDTVLIAEHLALTMPDTRILIYSKHNSASIIQRFINNGAHGFVNKLSTLTVLERAIEQLMLGEEYIDTYSSSSLLSINQINYSFAKLSPREYQLFRFLIQDLSYEQISIQAGISINTVGTYKTRIATKLGVGSREEMRKVARTLGM